MSGLVIMKGALHTQTRKPSDISNYFDRRDPLPGEQLAVDAYIREYSDSTPRTRQPSAHYNCHGLTFADRRTGIDSTEVRRILSEDTYVKIELPSVLPGDVIIYIGSEGEIDHSGIVVGLTKFDGHVIDTLVVSKWGAAHEVVHKSKECPWRNSQTEFYRMMR